LARAFISGNSQAFFGWAERRLSAGRTTSEVFVLRRLWPGITVKVTKTVAKAAFIERLAGKQTVETGLRQAGSLNQSLKP
jgi:hypothetical protein